MFESLKAKIHAGPTVKPVVVASKQVPDLSGLQAAAPQVAKAAPVVAVPSVPEPVPVVESEEPTIVEFEPEPVVVTPKLSKEPTIVDYMPEPEAAPTKRVPLTDPAGKLCAFLLADGTLVAVTTDSDDPLAKLSEDDKRPVDETEEARIDLAPRSNSRIIFLWETYENPTIDPSGVRLQKRLANDVARNLASRTRVEFDPERTANAAQVNRFRQR